MANILKKIPQAHQNEFKEVQASLIRSRVRLFCAMAIGIYIFVSAVSIVLFPQQFKVQEVSAAIFLLLGGAVILFFNQKTRTLKDAKLNAYLFTVLLLVVVTRIIIIYHEDADLSSAVYTFVLFLVSFTIPWLPVEIALIALLSVIAYSFSFFYISEYLPQNSKMCFDFESYFEGFILIATAFFMSFVIRGKDMAREVENFVLLKEVEAKNETMRRELELATKVHKTLIPRSISTDVVEIAALYLPAYYLGGDYAGVHFIDKKKLIFIICDVTGHGVSAALLVNRLHAEFEQLAQDGKEPGRLLNELNDFIVKDFDGMNMYLSAFCGMLDFEKMRFIYSNHGHPTQYLYRVSESEIIFFRSEAALLGIPIGDKNIHQHEIRFDRKDKVVLFTDGVIETMNKKREEYGIGRLEDFIRRNHAMQPDLFNHGLLQELSAFKSEDFKDDIFLLTMEIK